jgi:hypothetical protein
MTKFEPFHGRRWYDSKQPIRDSVEKIQSFPDTVQNHIGEGLVLVVEHRLKVPTNDFKALRSIGEQSGIEAVQALYKASQRKRSWDSIPHFHRAMTYWRMLPGAYQEAMAQEAINICHCVGKYLELCENKQRPLSEPEVIALIRAYIEQGPRQAATIHLASQVIMVAQPALIGVGSHTQAARVVVTEDSGDFKIRQH